MTKSHLHLANSNSFNFNQQATMFKLIAIPCSHQIRPEAWRVCASATDEGIFQLPPASSPLEAHRSTYCWMENHVSMSNRMCMGSHAASAVVRGARRWWYMSRIWHIYSMASVHLGQKSCSCLTMIVSWRRRQMVSSFGCWKDHMAVVARLLFRVP